MAGIVGLRDDGVSRPIGGEDGGDCGCEDNLGYCGRAFHRRVQAERGHDAPSVYVHTAVL
jgi:hypothetical protein